MTQFIKISDFLLLNLPNLRKWNRHTFLSWLQWHTMRLQVIFTEESGQILSAMVGRPINDLKQAKQPYVIDEDGEIFYVEQLACVERMASNGLLSSMKVRFPKVTKICFTRTKNGGVLKIYDLERFMKIASYGRKLESVG